MLFPIGEATPLPKDFQRYPHGNVGLFGTRAVYTVGAMSRVVHFHLHLVVSGDRVPLDRLPMAAVFHHGARMPYENS